MVAAEPRAGWPYARTVHLLGGARATDEYGPDVLLFPPNVQRRTTALVSPTFGSILATLHRHGLLPIAVAARHPGRRGSGLIPSDQRVFLLQGRSWSWACREQSDNWRGIAHAAVDAGDLILWDLAKRLGYQMEVCEWRLLQISNAYHEQLRAVHASRKPAQAGKRFEDGHTWHVYLTVQSFLVDCCILRDYLAEYVARYVLPEPMRTGEIDSMGGLIKRVFRRQVLTDKLLVDLNSFVSSGGWLSTLGAYRDLVVHCAPLARSESMLMAQLVEVPVVGHPAILTVKLPLPADPEATQASRKGPDRLKYLDGEMQRLRSVSSGHMPGRDALFYCYEVMGSLTLLSQKMMARSPREPKIPSIDLSDIRSIEIEED